MKKQFVFYMPEAQQVALRSFAKNKGLSMSAVIRIAIAEKLAL